MIHYWIILIDSTQNKTANYKIMNKYNLPNAAINSSCLMLSINWTDELNTCQTKGPFLIQTQYSNINEVPLIE